MTMLNAAEAPVTGAIRVMVVDDSAVVRGLIARQLGCDPQVCVVATAANGLLALGELEKRSVDVVVLDVEMPVMDGMTALAEIHRRYPKVAVVMASTATVRNAEISLKALQLGAADYVAKPSSGLGAAEDFKIELLAKVKVLGRRNLAAAPINPTAHAAPVPAAPRLVRSPHARPTRPAVLAIGSSTGGPPALLKLFEALRGWVEQPILLTQHMPPTFTALLAEQLSRAGERPCAEGRDGEPVLPGRCYVAPGGWHMLVETRGAGPVIRLNQEAAENYCRPAVDPMLRSAARVYGSGVLAVVLTGMGIDGARGCGHVAQAGGRFIAQDEATSVVWGMPGAAVATGLADTVLPLAEIGPWIVTACGVRL